MQCSVTVKGELVMFTSPYTDSEALAVLRGHIARRRILSSFAESLLRQAEDGKELSRRQFDWVHKIVLDSEEKGRGRVPKEISGQTRVAGSHRSVFGDYGERPHLPHPDDDPENDMEPSQSQ
jgi:hypothetical protein